MEGKTKELYDLLVERGLELLKKETIPSADTLNIVRTIGFFSTHVNQ